MAVSTWYIYRSKLIVVLSSAIFFRVTGQVKRIEKLVPPRKVRISSWNRELGLPPSPTSPKKYGADMSK